MFENREDGIKENVSEIQVTVCYDNVISVPPEMALFHNLCVKLRDSLFPLSKRDA
jgi:hypothetical protein